MPSVTVYAGSVDTNLANNWTNATNVQADDDTWATVAHAAPTTSRAVTFNFALAGVIPADAVVTSAILQVEWKVSTTAATVELRAMCGTVSGAVFTPAVGYSITDNSEPTAAAGVQRTRECIDLGWEALTAADFRVQLVSQNSSGTTCTSSVDYLRFVLTYVLDASATTSSASATATGLAATAASSCSVQTTPAVATAVSFGPGAIVSCDSALVATATATAAGKSVPALLSPWAWHDGAETSWADQNPTSPSWSDQNPSAATWSDQAVTTATWTTNPSTPWG